MSGQAAEFDSSPKPGHNRQIFFDGIDEDFDEWFVKETKTLAEMRDKLVAHALTFPDTISTDDMAARAADYDAQIGTLLDLIEAKRKEQKAPLDKASKQVQAFFNTTLQTGPAGKTLPGVRQMVRDRWITWGEKKDLLEKQRQKEEADTLAAEAAKAADEATAGTGDIDAAIELGEKAEQAARALEAPSSTRTTTRGDLGSTAFIQNNYEVEVLDIDKVPRRFMVPDYAALKKAVNGKNRLTQIDGCKIKKVAGMRNRRA